MITKPLPGIGTEAVESIALASYPGTVCPLLGVHVQAPENRVDVDQFIEMFLESRMVGSNAEQFEKYLALLFTLAGSCSTDSLKSIEGSVYVYVPDEGLRSAELYSIRFRGLEHLFLLTQGRKMPRHAIQKHAPEIERDRGIERGGMEP
ncbi:hypothetical protein P3T25_005647 [Paraburkholderia sp. GAS32]